MSAETAGSTSTVMRAPWLAWRRRCSALTTRRFSTIHLPRARGPLSACLETAASAHGERHRTCRLWYPAPVRTQWSALEHLSVWQLSFAVHA